jgi:hypothetical protein
MTAGEDASAWAHALEAVVGQIAPRFGRKEPRRRALADLKGLLAPVGDCRKIGGQAAIAIGGGGSLAGWNFSPKPEPSVPL